MDDPRYEPEPGTAPTPSDEFEASPRGAAALAVASFVLGLLAIVQLPLVLGPAGMVTGLLAHVKGHRAGFAGAVLSGITTVVGMSLLFLFDNPFEG